MIVGLTLFLTSCNETDEQQPEEDPFASADSIDTKLVNLHPILDAQVHKGDSLLMHLIALKDEGLLLEGDMIRLVSAFVREHGGTENPDSLLMSMTYRQLLDRSLLLDLSTEYGYDPTNCEGCNDSVLIFLPGTDARLFLGMGPKSLEKLILGVLKPNQVVDRYQRVPYNKKLDQESWKQTMESIAQEREDEFDGILFGNTLLLLTREGRNLNDFTFGDILTVIDNIKEMPEFERVRTYLNNLASDTTATEVPIHSK